MRKLSANYIYTCNNQILKNGIIELNDNGVITNIIDTKGDLREIPNLEFYNGVIVPGFINAHCHLELSHLKNKIPQKTGLEGFIKHIIANRNSDLEDRKLWIKRANNSMRKLGIVAVGDICNGTDSLTQKQDSEIEYQNFIEVFGFNPDFAKKAYENAKQVLNQFKESNLNASIVPHAPYSVSKELFKLIFSNSNNKDILSFHLQESNSENELFLTKTGSFCNHLESIGILLNNWKHPQKNALQSSLLYFPKENNTIFVHNTFTSKEDIKLAEEKLDNVYWCLCPNSNKYISDTYPQFENFKDTKTCIGTDSLASNTKLCILSEMKTIIDNSTINFETILYWATLNGAKALNKEKKLGSIEIGKSPGINLIEKFDFKNMSLKKDSTIKALI